MKKKMKVVIATILAVILIAVVAVVLYCLWFFFGAKSYTYYRSDDLGEIQSVLFLPQADKGEEGRFDSNEFIIYDKEIIQEIMDALEPLKLKPTYTINEPDGYKGFTIQLMDGNKKNLYLIGNYWEDCYQIWIGMENNGAFEDGVKGWIGQTTIPLEDGERLYELVNRILEDNIHNITVDELKKLAEQQSRNWNLFKQYFYTEEDTKDVRTWGYVTFDEIYKFQIEGTDAYLNIWAHDGIVDDEDGRNRYADVIDAVVYNENGESMNLYEEGISEFLEGLK